jgi:hypothetical protein
MNSPLSSRNLLRAPCAKTLKEEKMAEDIANKAGSCACDCECECCKSGKCASREVEKPNDNHVNWTMRSTDTVGSSFLGILAILMLVFLVRSNRRNRELLLEVIQLRRQP